MSKEAQQQAVPPRKPELSKFERVVIIGNKGLLYSRGDWSSQDAEFEELPNGALRLHVKSGTDMGKTFRLPLGRWEALESSRG